MAQHAPMHPEHASAIPRTHPGPQPPPTLEHAVGDVLPGDGLVGTQRLRLSGGAPGCGCIALEGLHQANLLPPQLLPITCGRGRCRGSVADSDIEQQRQAASLHRLQTGLAKLAASRDTAHSLTHPQTGPQPC